MTEPSEKQNATRNDGRFEASHFDTTHWSHVVKASERSDESEQALAELCQAYWSPLYAYVRSRVGNPQRAQDLTQTFFATLLEKNYLQRADPAKGRFRAFLLTAIKRLMANEWKKDNAIKRGGGKIVLHLDFDSAEQHFQLQHRATRTPEQLFHQDWVRSLLDRVFEQIQSEYLDADQGDRFALLRSFITVSDDAEKMLDVANRLGISVGAARVTVHRLRRRYRQVLRTEVAKTVRRESEIDDEIRSLFLAFS